MIATRSAVTGVCIVGESDDSVRLVCTDPDLCDGLQAFQPISSSFVYDWETVEIANETELLTSTATAARTRRAVDLVCILLAGTAQELSRDVIEDLEASLQTRVLPRILLSQLLRAPLKEIAVLGLLIKSCLAMGCGAIGKVLEQLRDYQPLLRRLWAAWSDLPESDFAGLGRPQDRLWLELTISGKIIDLVDASDANAFTNAWNVLAFAERSPDARRAVVRIGKALVQRLQGHGLLKANTDFGPKENEEDGATESDTGVQERLRPKPHVTYGRVLKQIEAIGRVVAEGDDQRAQRFLRELIDEQTEGAETAEYAIKSLCNIAQRCAEMFRTDFEKACLDKALELDPQDPWALVQYGDHLKRTGEYEAAITMLEKAVPSEPILARSNIADVYAQKGDYDTAIALYRAIPEWDTRITVRTAIADNLRREGKFAEALAMYEAMANEGMDSDRNTAGRAEIAKRQGNLQEAMELYQGLVHQPDLEPHTRHVYKVALAGVLKQMDRLDEAYRIIDDAVQKAPFDMRARAYRASVLGLLGREADGLKDVPLAPAPNAVGEFVRHFYAGVLLLKLGRFADARNQLVRNLQSALISGEDNIIMRLGAAVALLRQSEVGSAEGVLRNLPAIHDQYTRYLAEILQLHLAVLRRDKNRISILVRELEDDHVGNANLDHLYEAVIYLKQGKLQRAQAIEIDALLRLAA